MQIPEGAAALQPSQIDSMGSSICFGFLFMLVLDNVVFDENQHDHGHGMLADRVLASNPIGNSGVGPVDSGVLSPSRESHSDIEGDGAVYDHDGPGDIVRRIGSMAPPDRSRSHSASLGLMVHAAADGLALGAAVASSDRANLGLMVFMGLMLHKGPAAFGLTTMLLTARRTRSIALRHLLAFSVAAPVMAMMTFAILNFSLGSSSGETHPAPVSSDEIDTKHDDDGGLVPVALLFSGGTFL